MMNSDEFYMSHALKLAEKGAGFTNPNPLVGAVIVRDGKIIGEGYHEVYGQNHAEINAIESAGEPLEGATMYVTLEPCSHHGKTPPCADAIVKHRFKRVVIASKDPNPLVAGRGIEKLEKAGIVVESGLLDKENRKLNEIFFHFIRTKRPFVIMKSAMSADGKTATRTFDSKWITNRESRQFVHKLRHRVAAVMVGANTVINDDPLLTVRLEDKVVKHPTPIILDTCGEVPTSANAFKNPHTTPVVAVTKKAPEKKIQAFRDHGAKVLIVDEREGEVDLLKLMDTLGENGIDSILLEGGSAVNDSAVRSRILSKYYAFIAPKLIGGEQALSPVGGKGYDTVAESLTLTRESIETFDDDVLIVYKVGGV
ncbi:MAG: bifunctional diaminohydroxyphosphoribosylaminopyrimidine deaminase/5-amino-6-(5-phosphoribosylamino)uracil reductase RibD [Candidatus Izemoplasmataceae bacterium]